jgi:ABC-type transporter Mla MlaB component
MTVVTTTEISTMSHFQIESEGPAVRLRLSDEVTIEHARELHAALQAALRPESELSVDAAAVTRLDAAAVQVLLAAARVARGVALTAGSRAWDDAFHRFAFVDPFAAGSHPSAP